MFLPDDPESSTRNADNDKEEKVLVTPLDLRTEHVSCRLVRASMTSELEQSTFLINQSRRKLWFLIIIDLT